MLSMSKNTVDKMETAVSLYLSGVKCSQRLIRGFSEPQVCGLYKPIVEGRRAGSNR
jgi:hypothetical protein